MRKTDIHYILFVVIIILLITAVAGHAQSSCSTSVPCVQVSITNPNTLPSTTVLWSCMGSATSCSAAALKTMTDQQTLTTLCPNTPSVWQCRTFSQTKTPQNYNDLEPYGSLMNYSTQGTSAGGVSAASPITIFQVPQAPAQSTSIVGVPITVTVGQAGPQ